MFLIHNFQIGLDMKLKALFYYLNTWTKMSISIMWIDTVPILYFMMDNVNILHELYTPYSFPLGVGAMGQFPSANYLYM